MFIVGIHLFGILVTLSVFGISLMIFLGILMIVLTIIGLDCMILLNSNNEFFMLIFVYFFTIFYCLPTLTHFIVQCVLIQHSKYCFFGLNKDSPNSYIFIFSYYTLILIPLFSQFALSSYSQVLLFVSFYPQYSSMNPSYFYCNIKLKTSYSFCDQILPNFTLATIFKLKLIHGYLLFLKHADIILF